VSGLWKDVSGDRGGRRGQRYRRAEYDHKPFSGIQYYLNVKKAQLEISVDDRGGVFFVFDFYQVNSMPYGNLLSADHSAVSQASLNFNRFAGYFKYLIE
jgi:hypothetical protein